MTDQDKREFSIALGEHFPQLSKGDAKLCWDKCRSFTLDTFRRAVEQYRVSLGSDVWRPDPQGIAAICWRIERPGAGPLTRTSDYLQQFKRLEADVENDAARVDALIASMSDEEFNAERDAALAAMPPLVARLVAKAVDQRACRVLKSWIATSRVRDKSIA